MAKPKNEGAVEVRRLKPRPGVRVGKPQRVGVSSTRRVAYPATGGVMGASGGNFYSPALSTDFLELPQSLDEKRNYYRFFYDNDPFVGQAMDLHTELPLSKVRLGLPKAKDPKKAEAALDFCSRWAEEIGLLHRLVEIVHDYNLFGEVFVFCEDTSPDMPEDILYETHRVLNEFGEALEKKERRADADARALRWLRRNYSGWTSIRTLPPEQIHMESFSFTDEHLIEAIPDSKSKDVVMRADSGDKNAIRIAASMPRDVVEAIRAGTNIPLNTDPDAGSFVHYMSRKKSQYEARGHSMLERCLLPGTPVTVERDGIVQQVPVETVNPTTDLLLTHKGRFRRATMGSRLVQENVTVLTVEGTERPLALTADHRVLRVTEDGREEWVQAGHLQEGDLLREAHVVPTAEAPTEIDLAEWWRGRTLAQTRDSKRYGPRERTLTVEEVTESRDGSLVVVFQHDGDSLSQRESLPRMRRLLAWLKGLTGPTEASYEAVCAVTDLTYRDVHHYAAEFRKRLGLRKDVRSLGRGKGTVTTWHPLPADAQLWGETVTHVETSDTARLPLDEDFLYLLGTWLGDGCTWDGGFLNASQLGWAVSKEHPAFHRRIVELAQRYFGATAVTEDHPYGEDFARPTTYVGVKDPLLARYFRTTFGADCYTKHLPRWVFDLGERGILALLRGVLDTDGHLNSQPSIGISLANKVLIDQLHLLCNRVGLHTNVKWAKGNGKWNTLDRYPALSCCRSADVKRWATGAYKESSIEWREKKGWPSRFVDGNLTRKVEATAAVPYVGPVYSFDVEEDESLVAGKVAIHNCLRTLVFRDKLRQAQTSIASRHMTPIRLVYAENASANDVDMLRDQVDLALQDPDYSIVTNFQVNWEELGSQQRLLELSSEYELTDRQLYAGLGVTESLLSGESSYSGDRINLEVINTRYMLLREVLQDMVERKIFRPMCRRMGFIEVDEDGIETVITPTLSFTRLALRDNADTFDHLLNLYQKGSLGIGVILDLLNIDSNSTQADLKRDVMTLNDSTFNEVLRSAYGDVGRQLVETTDIVERIAKLLELKYAKKEEEAEGRF
jgi:hypothetical protein